MKISISTDTLEGIGSKILSILKDYEHELLLHGSFADQQNNKWAEASALVAQDVVKGHAHMGIVMCWTGTGATIAANKIKGARAALCHDAYTAAGAKKWNDANILALSVRMVSEPLLKEILEAWFTNQNDGSQTEHLNYLTSI